MLVKLFRVRNLMKEDYQTPSEGIKDKILNNEIESFTIRISFINNYYLPE